MFNREPLRGEIQANGTSRFMTHWDGLSSTNAQGDPQRICILGATNRIQDIDEAILRRMPKKFPVSLPNAHQRRGIFDLILRDTKIDRHNFDVDQLVKLSAGMSGSDIKEACRDAAMFPVREYIAQMKKQGRLKDGVNAKDVRGVRTGDFFGRAGSMNAQYIGFDKPIDVREKERRREVQAEEMEVVSDDGDEGFETTSETSERSEKARGPGRERVFERENGPD
jgi:SpoVK/Ycf46/Vps4 family AAA+-type ATPase